MYQALVAQAEIQLVLQCLVQKLHGLAHVVSVDNLVTRIHEGLGSVEENAASKNLFVNGDSGGAVVWCVCPCEVVKLVHERNVRLDKTVQHKRLSVGHMGIKTSLVDYDAPNEHQKGIKDVLKLGLG